jgi:hypothetical protein
MFEPAGEECGTGYDSATACPTGGAGRTSTGPLRLRVEVVTPRFREVRLAHKVRGWGYEVAHFE